MRFACRELREADWGAVERIVQEGPRAHTMLLEPLLRAARAGDPNVWWYGALAGGTELQAVMGVRGHSAVIHSRSDDATDALAKEALEAQRTAMPTGTHRHELFGEVSSMERFWRIFRDVGRQVVVDRARPLYAAAPGLEPPSKRAKLRVATTADLKVVVELSGEHALEALGYDPRRTGRAAHERRRAEAIAAGRQLIAEQGGKPVLIAEVKPLDDLTVMLERVFVPRPSRALKRLVGGALVGAANSAPVGGREVLFFAEVDGLAQAAERAGFALRATYHAVAMLG